MRIRDGDSSDPGWKKVGSGIRDKHPGSATLVLQVPPCLLHTNSAVDPDLVDL
jgi:hypothetical protein